MYVDAEEYESIVKQAGEGKVSEWARERLLGDDKPVQRLESKPKSSTVGNVFKPESEKIYSKEAIETVKQMTGKCPHHKMKGELCYKCDPKMGYPSL